MVTLNLAKHSLNESIRAPGTEMRANHDHIPSHTHGNQSRDQTSQSTWFDPDSNERRRTRCTDEWPWIPVISTWSSTKLREPCGV